MRDPTQVWLLALVTCGLYGLYFIYLTGFELKNYLGKEELNPTLDILFSLMCPFFSWFVIIKYGRYIQEAQQRAGVANAEDRGVMFVAFMLLCLFGYSKMQEELNKIWQAGGPAPAAY